MSRFIPTDTAQADALRERFAASLYRDPETFVNAYNSGLISKNNEENKVFAKDIVATFKDVKERRGRLAFISENEVVLDEALSRLTVWASIIRLKRELSDLIVAGELNEQAEISPLPDGSFFEVGEDGSAGEPVQGLDRLKQSDIDAIENLPGIYSNGNMIIIPVSLILSVDDSFVDNLNIPPLS